MLLKPTRNWDIKSVGERFFNPRGRGVGTFFTELKIIREPQVTRDVLSCAFIYLKIDSPEGFRKLWISSSLY